MFGEGAQDIHVREAVVILKGLYGKMKLEVLEVCWRCVNGVEELMEIGGLGENKIKGAIEKVLDKIYYWTISNKEVRP